MFWGHLTCNRKMLVLVRLILSLQMLVVANQVDWGYGVLVSVMRQQAVTVADVGTYLVDVLLAVDQKSLSGPSACPLPAKMGE